MIVRAERLSRAHPGRGILDTLRDVAAKHAQKGNLDYLQHALTLAQRLLRQFGEAHQEALRAQQTR